MKIENEILEKLQVLKGINLDVALRIFKENKLDVKASGFVENLIALLLERELPKNKLGMDFLGLFEVKEIKLKVYTRKGVAPSNFTKKGKISTGGDTNISTYIGSEPNFFESNIWDKSKRILIVCVDMNRVIHDVRFFDSELYAEDMKNDYDAIIKYKNLCRKNNKILVFKTGYNSIMLKGNSAIDMSESVFFDNERSEIVNQDSYIRELFESKFASYQEKMKNASEVIFSLMNKLNISELQKVIEQAQLKITESVGFNMNAGSELEF